MNTAKNREIAIIGAGPNCVYALDILLRALQTKALGTNLTVKIFEKSGEFGSGSTHSVHTPITAALNRTAGQIALGASHFYKPNTLDKFIHYKNDFMEWSRERYQKTSDEKYNFVQSDWPPRQIFGEAMSDAFAFCYTALNEISGVNIELINESVVDILTHEDNDLLSIVTTKHIYKNIERSLVITGNIDRSISRNSWIGELYEDCKETKCLLVENPFPMSDNLSQLGEFKEVFLIGTGTTAIDVINYLYNFDKELETNLKIYPISRNGLFCYSRSINQKSVAKNNFHKGYVFTYNLIDQIRLRSQKLHKTNLIDFELDILPLLIAEMSIKYYSTLLGSSFETQAVAILTKKVSDYLSSSIKFGSCNEAETFFTHDICQKGEQALFDIKDYFIKENWATMPINISYFKQYIRTVCPDLSKDALNSDILETISQALINLDGTNGFFSDPLKNKFEWAKIIDPINKNTIRNVQQYKDELIAFMKRDIEQSKQGNIANPTKAALDGIWRDLRDEIIYSIGKGKSNSSSYLKFIDYYLPLHNRLVDGPGIEAIENIIEKIETRRIELDYIYGSMFKKNQKRMEIVGPFSKTNVCCITLGTLDLFKRSYRKNKLYDNLLKSGLVQMWNCCDGDEPSEMGLDLNDHFHPIQSDGRPDTRLTFLGPACEGYHLFQHTLSRPDKEQPAITNLVTWLEEFV